MSSSLELNKAVAAVLTAGITFMVADVCAVVCLRFPLVYAAPVGDSATLFIGCRAMFPVRFGMPQMRFDFFAGGGMVADVSIYPFV